MRSAALQDSRGDIDPIEAELAGDSDYRRAVLACLEGGQYRDLSSYWAFDPQRWFAKHLGEVRRREHLLATLASYQEFDGRRVLVAGSGMGAELIALRRRGARVVGLDLELGMLVFSRMRARRHGVRPWGVCADALAPPFSPQTFDWVFLRQILEHLPRRHQPGLVASCARLLRPGGCLFLDTPNRRDLLDRHDSGLPLVHWLAPPLRRALARRLGRAVPTLEPGAGGDCVAIHDFATFGQVRRWLRSAGKFEVLSHYKEFPDLESWWVERCRQGRGGWRARLRRRALAAFDALVGLNRVTPIRAVFRLAVDPTSRNPSKEGSFSPSGSL